MILLTGLNFSLPLSNPVIIFSLVLFIILFAPILLKKIKVPHIIGLILAGVAVGPYALNLLRRDSSIVLFGTVGLLYIMFLAGLEIDISEFKKNRKKIFFYGITTFTLPLVFGTIASYYVLGYGWLSSVLLASMFSTHTLVSYPIASKYGVSRNRAVGLTVGGTMITDILALLILAIIAGMTKGDVTSAFWVTLGVSTLVFVGIVFFIFPIIIRWFFKNYEDSVSQYIFVLAIVFLASFLAEAAGIEAIIGAFFAGLVLNNFVPNSSPLMNRIDFVGNALFIPFFLIGVGMLVNFNVLFNGWGALRVAGVIVTVAISTKYIAAWITQKTFKLLPEEGKMIFGLSTSHAAATLAIILVGYNIIIGETPGGEPIRLLDEDILNGTILLILISCAISSFVVEKAAAKLAEIEGEEVEEVAESKEKILITLAYPDTVAEMVDFALMMRPNKSNIPVYALTIISDDINDETSQASGKKMMQKALNHAAATEDTLIPLTRYDLNISNAIIYTIKEQNITDVLIGLHKNANQKDFLGPITENILSKTGETIFIYKNVQPFNTLNRMVIVITPKAEREPGFYHWFTRISTIAKTGGLSFHFFASELAIVQLKKINDYSTSPVPATYNVFNDWEDFLILGRELKPNDFFVIVSSRKMRISYDENLEKLPYYLSKYFIHNSYIIIYPKQSDEDAILNEKEHSDNFLFDALADKVQVVNKAGGYISRLFKRKKEVKRE
ncbi:MAG: cation:proton antiporter [Ginsengibacter sp.]